MRIESITVSYGLTQSLPNYSNVKPSLSLTATLHDGDDPHAVRRALMNTIKRWVEEEVDSVLERHNKPAHYSHEPRYQVVRTRSREVYDHREFPQMCLAVVPDDVDIPDGYVTMSYEMPRGMRYHHALAQASAYAQRQNMSMIVCATNDLSSLPTLQDVHPDPDMPSGLYTVSSSDGDDDDGDDDDGDDDDGDDDDGDDDDGDDDDGDDDVLRREKSGWPPS